MPSPLQSPRLRRILAAYTVNRLGTWFGLVALSLAVFDHTHSALAVAALLFAWQALPAFLVPALVARVEASARRSELSGLYFFEAVATAALAVLLWHFWLPAVLLLAALDGTAALAASALLRAEVARAAREQAQRSEALRRTRRGPRGEAQEAERKANAALNVAFSATFVLGPVLGGAGGRRARGARRAVHRRRLVSDLRRAADRPAPARRGGGRRFRRRPRCAPPGRHINEAPALRGLLLTEAVALVFIESAGPIEVAYAKATLHAGDRGYGLLRNGMGSGRGARERGLRALAATAARGDAERGTFALGARLSSASPLAPSLALACVAALVGRGRQRRGVAVADQPRAAR